MDKSKFAKSLAVGLGYLGFAAVVPTLAPFFIGASGGFLGGVLGKLFEGSAGGDDSLAKSTLSAVSSVFANLSSESFPQIPGALSKAHNQNLERALASAYIDGVKAVAAGLRENHAAGGPLNIGGALTLETRAQMDELLPLLAARVKRSIAADPSSLFTERIKENPLLGLSDDTPEEAQRANSVESTLLRWAHEQRIYEGEASLSISPTAPDALPPATLPKPLREHLRRRLPAEIEARFGELIERPEYQKSWVALQRAHLQGIAHLLREQKGKNEQVYSACRELVERADRLSSLPEVVKQLADTASELLRRTREGESGLTPFIEASVGRLRDVEDKLAHVVRLCEGQFRRGGDVISFNWMRKQEGLIQSLTETPAADRQGALRRLQEISTADGYHLISAVGGAGKSTLLAHWIWRQKQADPDVNLCYYFFNHAFGTEQYAEFINSLAEQLLLAEGIVPPVRQLEDYRLEVIIGTLLSIPRSRRLTVVIDGLDEASRPSRERALPFHKNFFPAALPEGTAVLLSARTLQEEGPEDDWRARLGLTALGGLPLAPLESGEVRQILIEWARVETEAEEKFPALEEAALNTALPEIVRERTGGLAVYVRHIAEQLNTERPTDLLRAATEFPHSFDEFIKHAAQAVDDDKRWQWAFKFLALARVPLSDRDLTGLTRRAGHGLAKSSFSAIQWDIRRWLVRVNSDQFAFQHAKIGDAYAKLYLDGEERAEVLGHVLSYCKDWPSNGSPYALRHYPELLRESGPREELYELARDGAFARRQCEDVPDLPDLPLRTLQVALRAAVDADDGAVMAEFVLGHARRRVELSEESPLSALQAGGGLRRACKLAELTDAELGTLWHLLLTWAARDKQGEVEARTVLESVEPERLPRFSAWQARHAAYLLAQVCTVDPARANSLARRILDDEGRRELAEFLLEESNFRDAFSLSDSIGEEQLRDEFRAIVLARSSALECLQLLEDGRAAEADQLFLRAMQHADSVTDRWKRATTRAYLVVALTQGGMAEKANQYLSGKVEAASHTATPEQRAELMSEYAITQALAGLTEAAERTFLSAAAHTRDVEAPPQRASLLLLLAESLVRCGLLRNVHSIAQDAWDLMTSPEAQEQQDDLLTQYLSVSAWAGDFSRLIDFAAYLDAHGQHATMLPVVRRIEHIAEEGLPGYEISESSLEAARKIQTEPFPEMVLGALALAHARRGELDTATDILKKVNGGLYSPAGRAALRAACAFHVAEGNAERGRSLLAQSLGAEGRVYIPEQLQTLRRLAEQFAGSTLAEQSLASSSRVSSSLHDAAAKVEELWRNAITSSKVGLLARARADIDAALSVTAHRNLGKRMRLGLLRKASDVQQEIMTSDLSVPMLLLVLADLSGEVETATLSTWEILVRAMADSLLGQQEQAVEGCRAARREAQQILDKQGHADVLILIAQTLEHLGRRDEAMEVLTEAEGVIEEISEPHRSVLLPRVAARRIGLGDTEGAYACAVRTEIDIFQSSVLQGVATAYARAGDFKRARETAELISETLPKMKALAELIPRARQAGHADDAHAAWEKLLDLSTKLEDVGNQAEAQATLARACLTLDEVAGARSAVQKGLRILENAGEENDGALMAIVDAQVTLLKAVRDVAIFPDVVRAVQRIVKEKDRAWALELLIKTQIEIDFAEDALETTNLIVSNRASVLSNIAVSLSARREALKLFALPCSHYLASAYSLTDSIARVYPNCAEEIVAVVTQQSES